MRWLAALCAALLAACAPAPRQVAPAPGLPTIVSLNPCADAILAEIAAPGQLLAVSHYSHDPAATSMPIAQARRYKATGGTVEEVLALDPDMVVGSSFMAPATAAAFARLGIRVETLGIAASMEESKAQIATLAAAIGRSQSGAALAGRIDAAMAASAHRGAPISAILWQPGGIVPGEGTLVHQMMEHAGLASHSAARGFAQADHLSLERLLADPPQVLLLAGQERAQSHPALAALPDLRAEHFAPDLLYCGGPTIIRALDRLAGIRK